MRHFFALIVLLTPLAANADWTLITRADDGTEFHIFDGSVEINGASRKASVLILKPQGSSDQVRSVLNYNEIDCANRRYRILRLAQYDAAGKQLNTFDEPTEWATAHTRTVADSIVDAACYGTANLANEREQKLRELEEQERRAEEEEARRERSLKQAEYGFCIADCSSRPGATLLMCMAQCSKDVTR